MIISCTRRLRSRASGVSLPSTGRFAPWPMAVRRKGATPLSMKSRTTLDARTEVELGYQSGGPLRSTVRQGMGLMNRAPLEYEDEVAILRHVATHPAIDADRLFHVGVSHAGEMLFKLLSHYPGLLRAGDVLGTVGMSGNADPRTPHLHFAVARLAGRASRGPHT